jgi:hypothetical protein
MKRILCALASVGALNVMTACGPSTTPPDSSAVPPRAADTVLYVGTAVPLYSLLLTSSGIPYSPTATTRGRIVAGTSDAIRLTGDSVFALNPGAILVEVRDDAAKWVTRFRIGSVYDIRRRWHFESLCRTDSPNPFDYTNSLTEFTSTGPATIIGPSVDGYPQWTGATPSATATLSGISTDSVFHFYLHSDNYVRPDTAVKRAVVTSTISVDSSSDIQYTSPTGVAIMHVDGLMSWSSDRAPICIGSSTGSRIAFRARLDAL